MDLFEQISNDIKEAMKAKDKVRLETLRNVKKCFLEAKTAPGANDTLTDEAALKIMQKLVKQGKDSAAVYEGQGRADLAEEEMARPSASPASSLEATPITLPMSLPLVAPTRAMISFSFASSSSAESCFGR